MSCQHARARIHSALSLTLRALSLTHASLLLSPQAKAEKKKGKKGKAKGGGSDLKRPPSAYLLYCNNKREKVKNENPGAGATEIIKILAEKWKGISDERRANYERQAAELKEEYDVKKAALEAKAGGPAKKKQKTGESSAAAEEEEEEDEEEEEEEEEDGRMVTTMRRRRRRAAMRRSPRLASRRLSPSRRRRSRQRRRPRPSPRRRRTRSRSCAFACGGGRVVRSGPTRVSVPGL